MNVLRKIDEHHRRDTQGFCARNRSWRMLMLSRGGGPEERREIRRTGMNLNKNRCPFGAGGEEEEGGAIRGGFTARRKA